MATSTRTTARTTKRRRTPPPPLLIRVGRAVARQLAQHRDDVVGVGLLAAAALVALGTYADAAGPVGAFLEALVRGLFGIYGYLAPILLAVFGVHVVLGRPSRERGRLGVGVTLVAIGAVGGWHLLRGVPDLSEGVRALWPAGGLLGYAIARPLRAGLGTWGAGVLLLAVAGLGTLILTRTPLPRVWAAVRTTARWLWRHARAAVVALVRRAGRTEGGGAGRTPEGVGGAAPDRTTASGPVEAPGEQLVLIDEGDGAPSAAPAVDTPAARPAPEPTPAAVEQPSVRRARPLRPVTDWRDYQLPPLDLLQPGSRNAGSASRQAEEQAEVLRRTFAQFGIDATVPRWTRGPTVTRFEVELGPGVQVRKVVGLADDIAYALAAPDVRIVAPIPGKSAIGIEVPNRERDHIALRDILSSRVAAADPHPMLVALGVDIAGNPAMVNLTTMPHLLVSGATGAGKSVTLNAMITSVVMRARPDQVRMILIDPKRVELNHYDGVPHLLTPVVVDPRRATDALQWAVKEMELRYQTLARLGFRDIDGYNRAVAAGEVPAPTAEEQATYQHMPYILIVIDELSDLMLIAPRDVEDAICRIAQMARAVGIHMVIATQRPSVDVITGLIKANIPSRLALSVASQTDSRTILDQAGAEKLVGRGDMLFLPANASKPIRLQGCYVSETEIRAVVEFCRRQREATYVEGIVREGRDAEDADLSRGDAASDEVLLRRAAEQVVRTGLGSTSMLQRKLRIGFARAGRLMDELEQLGVVGPNEGSKAREVLWTEEQLQAAIDAGIL